jgi:hypothetical protein
VLSDPFLHIAGLMVFPKEWFDGEDVMRLPLALKDKVTFNPDAATRFRFIDESEGWELMIADLFAMHQFVADIVFPAFARFFK